MSLYPYIKNLGGGSVELCRYFFDYVTSYYQTYFFTYNIKNAVGRFDGFQSTNLYYCL